MKFEIKILLDSQNKKPGFFTCICYQGEELPGLHCKINTFMAYNKDFFKKVFSDAR